MARKPQAPVPAMRRDPDEKLTLAEVCTELRIERSTFYDWRARAGLRSAASCPTASCASFAGIWTNGSSRAGWRDRRQR